MTQAGADPTAGIESAIIDPDAEPRSDAAPSVSGQKEAKFFEAGRNEHELKMAKHRSGWFGILFGSAVEAPTNIAGFLVVCCVIIIVCCVFAPPTSATEKIQTWAVSLITLIIGYLFGAKSKD